MSPVITRAIVRNLATLSGRWVLEGTNIPIAQIRADVKKLGRRGITKTYSSILLLDDELDSILAFDFPPVREFGLNIALASAFLECICGEDTPVIMHGSATVVECVCGRIWEIVLAAQQVADAKA